MSKVAKEILYQINWAEYYASVNDAKQANYCYHIARKLSYRLNQ